MGHGKEQRLPGPVAYFDRLDGIALSRMADGQDLHGVGIPVRQLVGAGFQFVHREEDLIVGDIVENAVYNDIVEFHCSCASFGYAQDRPFGYLHKELNGRALLAYPLLV